MTSSTKIALWVIGILVVVIGVSAYIMRDSSTSETTTDENGDAVVACTMDAKMCPDGSYVGRVAPNCQFAACPVGTSTTPVGTNNGEVYPADILK